MSTLRLLYEKSYEINDAIHVVIPTVGQIIADEDAYYNLVTMFTAMPIDMMLQLDDAGIDFTTINEYELFLLLFQGIQMQDTSLILGDLDLKKFQMAVNQQNGNVVLRDEESGATIDKAIHEKIAVALRRIHYLEKDNRKPANEEAKKYMLERARVKAKRRKNRKQDSQLEELIIAMVNTPEYKYNFEGTKDLTIYQFNESVRQVIKKVDYNNKMIGVYSGTVDTKKLNQNDLNWLSHKKKK